ncbi:hypothetical protein CLIB1444_01S06832 [[Candida] jaroonii]|uniref:Uncharacterized protein n=1 Tax=[Candida] jaroonii TaxID=467808 RepID=A0ACA9Y0J0_9ASCO|nr:hypothetical protein CLIB1444_01S06832 [[Candida] jaroonii]
MSNRPGRKRDRNNNQPQKAIKLSLEDWGKLEELETVDEESILKHLQQLGESVKIRTTDNVYIKLQITQPEAQYLEEFHQQINENLKQYFDVPDILISDSIPGVIERFITLNGKLKSVIRATLYLTYKTTDVNNINHEGINLETLFFLTFYLQDTMDSDRLRQIEQKAKFSKLKQFELTKPNHFSPSGTYISIIDIKGTFETIFDFLSFTLESSPNKSNYIEDSKIWCIPVIFNDSEVTKNQDVNKDLISNSIKQSLSHIYEKSFIDQIDKVQ